MQHTKVTISPRELRAELLKRRLTVRKKGLSTGWAGLDEFMSLKRGYPIFLAADSGIGKTEFCFDLLINASVLHNFMNLILSPETGDAEEITEYIIEKASGKSIDPKSDNTLTEEEYDKYLGWVHNHFRILDRHRGWDDSLLGMPLNLKNFFEQIDKEEKILMGNRYHFDSILVDPFNELDDVLGPNIAGNVKDELDVLLKWTKAKNYVTILTNHTNPRKKIQMTAGNGMRYLWMPPATKEDWAFGQQFNRKGYQMIYLDKPHEKMQDDEAMDGDTHCLHSQAHFYNMREVYIQKSKPKGVGKTGMTRMFYNHKTQRYYEVDSIGVPCTSIFPQV